MESDEGLVDIADLESEIKSERREFENVEIIAPEAEKRDYPLSCDGVKIPERMTVAAWKDEFTEVHYAIKIGDYFREIRPVAVDADRDGNVAKITLDDLSASLIRREIQHQEGEREFKAFMERRANDPKFNKKEVNAIHREIMISTFMGGIEESARDFVNGILGGRDKEE